MEHNIDVVEDKICNLSSVLLETLLKDRSSNKNIIWATDNYSKLGIGYQKKDHIFPASITGRNNTIIRPRVAKTKEEQIKRIRDNAEVFTPSWICNAQNNLIDQQWFGSNSPFNEEKNNSWITIEKKISFSETKTWTDYVDDTRLEITCGEAPYLTSRYDTVSGKYIDPNNRIGLLDRKLRVISENVNNKKDWINYAKRALQSSYGFEFQGDSLLIARENILLTVMEHYEALYDEIPNKDILIEFAEIISWNIWQMDGLKYVIPLSCHNEDIEEFTLFGTNIIHQECPGCKKNAVTKHNGIYCKIKDWEKNKTVKYVNVVTRGKRV